ncbi:unnamed protein product, partial [Rotaria magnacalcarata]
MSDNSASQGTVVVELSTTTATPIHEVIEVPATIPATPL